MKRMKFGDRLNRPQHPYSLSVILCLLPLLRSIPGAPYGLLLSSYCSISPLRLKDTMGDDASVAKVLATEALEVMRVLNACRTVVVVVVEDEEVRLGDENVAAGWRR